MLKVVELFAGVGGFRIGLEGWKDKSSTSGFTKKIDKKFKFVWSNQYEPLTPNTQHASLIYKSKWPDSNHSNEDIEKVIKNKFKSIPNDYDLLVGGFPCQDFSVATTLKHSGGIEGKKGVLWWSIYHILNKAKKKPKFLILENVDRLLKSPSNQRGRDFAIMLGCLRYLGYIVEWRVINAAEYGFAQRRRRIFLVGYHKQNKKIHDAIKINDGIDWIKKDGVLAKSFKINPNLQKTIPFYINRSRQDISDNFGKGFLKSPFLDTGILIGSRVYTYKSEPLKKKKPKTLRKILEPESVTPEFYIDNKDLDKWKALKDPISVDREKDGFKYKYSMGGIGFDNLDKPSRTIITGEGGKSPSRFKHIIEYDKDRYRRLTPIELEKLNGFPKDWTNLEGVTDAKRAFLMGNAVVCGIVELIGNSLFNIFNKNK